MSPTSDPTSQPTTLEPTAAPTPHAPWTITFLGMGATWDPATEEEVVLRYYVGRHRPYEAHLYGKDCETPITDIHIGTSEERTDENATHDLLTLSHSINKTAVTSSSIWNSTARDIGLCQVVQLFVPAAGEKAQMLIAEDLNRVNLDFDLEPDYDVSGIRLINETRARGQMIKALSVQPMNEVMWNPVSARDWVTSHATPQLAPNEELHVTFESVLPGVEIDQVASMSVKQGKKKNMDVIDQGLVMIPSIADMTYDAGNTRVVVSTFVPTNVFDYSGGTLSIIGRVDMKFAGAARNLRDSDGAGEGKALYALRIELRNKKIYKEEAPAIASVPGSVASGRASALLGTALLLASAIWQWAVLVE